METDPTVSAVDFFPLVEAARFFPRPNGKKVSVKTLYRWASSGMRKGKLRTIRLGQQVCTCEAWVRLFIAELNGLGADVVSELGPTTAETRRRELVNRKLDTIGI
jgi:Protein of unknown function (DUF1580)